MSGIMFNERGARSSTANKLAWHREPASVAERAENVMAIVRRTVPARFRATTEYDDILAEGYLAAWQGYEKARAAGRYRPTTAAFWAARQAPAAWLRRWCGQGERPEVLSLEVGWRELDGRADLPCGADFAPGVLDRLQAEEWLALCRPREALVLRCHLLEGWPLVRCARALGVTLSRVQQIQTAGLRRIRRELGLAARVPTAPRPGPDTPARLANRERMAAYRRRLKEEACPNEAR